MVVFEEISKPVCGSCGRIKELREEPEVFGFFSDCKTKMDVDAENYELVCRSCGRTKELHDVEFNKKNWKPSETVSHLQTKGNKIFDVVSAIRLNGRETCDPTRSRFLGIVIHNFSHDGRKINCACFLHNYFEAVPSEAWPQK